MNSLKQELDGYLANSFEPWKIIDPQETTRLKLEKIKNIAKHINDRFTCTFDLG